MLPNSTTKETKHGKFEIVSLTELSIFILKTYPFRTTVIAMLSMSVSENDIYN